MPHLHPPADQPNLITEISPHDTMYDGRNDHYLHVGRSALSCITLALAGKNPACILDLPCGHGRITRHLRAAFPKAAITVCDLDRDGVDFSAATFNATPVYSSEDLSTLKLPGRFDLIWVGSLVTHLSLAQTTALFHILGKSLAARGVIIASAHGPSIAPGLNDWGYGLEKPEAAALLRDYGATGYAHRGYNGSAGYGISISDKLFWSTYFSAGDLILTDYTPQAWDGHQDVLTLRRRGLFSRPKPLRIENEPAERALRQAASQHDPALAAFDSAYYLAQYPDVAAAVTAGHFTSAFHHYWQRGRFEARTTTPA